MNKNCVKCGKEKPLDEFYSHKPSKNGRTARCKECLKAEHQEYRLRTRPAAPRIANQRRRDLLLEGKKECKGCCEIKLVGNFYVDKNERRSPYCKTCSNAKSKKYLQENRKDRNAYHREYSARPENKARHSAVSKKRRESSPRVVMQITLRHGLKRKPTPNPATIDDLMRKFVEQDGRCALTGIKMTWAKGHVLPASVSLDRIDFRKGYSDDNIRLICHAINAFRGRMSDDEMLAMARILIAKSDDAEPSWRGFGYSAPIHTFTEH